MGLTNPVRNRPVRLLFQRKIKKSTPSTTIITSGKEGGDKAQQIAEIAHEIRVKSLFSQDYNEKVVSAIKRSRGHFLATSIVGGPYDEEMFSRMVKLAERKNIPILIQPIYLKPNEFPKNLPDEILNHPRVFILTGDSFGTFAFGPLLQIQLTASHLEPNLFQAFEIIGKKMQNINMPQQNQILFHSAQTSAICSSNTNCHVWSTGSLSKNVSFADVFPPFKGKDAQYWSFIGDKLELVFHRSLRPHSYQIVDLHQVEKDAYSTGFLLVEPRDTNPRALIGSEGVDVFSYGYSSLKMDLEKAKEKIFIQ